MADDSMKKYAHTCKVFLDVPAGQDTDRLQAAVSAAQLARCFRRAAAVADTAKGT